MKGKGLRLLIWNTHRRDNVNNLLIALSLTLNFLSASINLIVRIDNLVPILSVLIFLISLINNRCKFSRFYFPFIFVVSIQVIISLFFGYLNFDLGRQFALFFIMNAILLTYIISHGFNFDLICKYIIIIYTSFVWMLLFFDKSSFSGGSLMGWSYAILPLFLSVIYILFLSNENKKKKFFVLLILILYGSKVILFASRGAILAFCMFWILYELLINKSKGFPKKLLLLVVVLIAIINYDSILLFLNALLTSINIDFPFVKEMAIRIQENTIDNGRFQYYERSWSDFIKNPIFGNGIGAVNRLYGSNYDHNLFIQLLNEGGIVFGSIHIFLIGKAIMIMVKERKSAVNDYTKFILFLLSISVVRLMFSYSYWMEQGYWMLLYIAFVYKFSHPIKTDKVIKIRVDY